MSGHSQGVVIEGAKRWLMFDSSAFVVLTNNVNTEPNTHCYLTMTMWVTIQYTILPRAKCTTIVITIRSITIAIFMPASTLTLRWWRRYPLPCILYALKCFQNHRLLLIYPQSVFKSIIVRISRHVLLRLKAKVTQRPAHFERASVAWRLSVGVHVAYLDNGI